MEANRHLGPHGGCTASFFVEWECTANDHPSSMGGPVSIGRLEISGDPDTVSSWLGEPRENPLNEIDVDWVEADDAGVLAVWFNTPNGMVRVE